MTYWYVRHESFFDTWYPEYGTQEKEELWCGDIQAHPGYNLGVSMDEFADAGNSIGNAEEYSAATKCEQAAQYVLDLVPEYTGEHQEALRTLRSAQADKQRIVAHTAKKAQAD